MDKIIQKAVTNSFKAYDIRGKVPDELNEEIVRKIGNVFTQFLGKEESTIVIGYDIRLTSKSFKRALIDGITDAGSNVVDIGLVGTDMVYFVVAHYNFDGGIMVTASHNPVDYNGLKLVREKAFPLSIETGLEEIKNQVLTSQYYKDEKKGTSTNLDVKNDYLDHILSFIDINSISPLKIVMNAGNGCAGIILPDLIKRIPQLSVFPKYWEPDGTFPNGIPNPLLIDKREDTSKEVISKKADLGVAWDGDFDRCFFFDENGNFIEGYYLVAVLGGYFARKIPEAIIIHDPRLIWAIEESVSASNGKTVECKSGHSFIKEMMRKIDATYAGEMSAHHYFKQNFYADNGLIPMLLILEILSKQNVKMSELIKEWKLKYPVSGEINIEVHSSDKVFAKIMEKYSDNSTEIKTNDGISFQFSDWRFNIRKSNTESVIRLNVEAKHKKDLMQRKTKEIIELISLINED